MKARAEGKGGKEEDKSEREGEKGPVVLLQAGQLMELIWKRPTSVEPLEL